MAQAESQHHDALIERATSDPYAHMEQIDKEYIADEYDIIPVDATKDEKLADRMSWAEQNIGLGRSLLCITDYGRHRESCDTLADFVELVREQIRDGFGSQYLKIMDEEKEEVAGQLAAISRANGYVVVPYFGGSEE